MVEHLTADQEVPNFTLGAPFSCKQTKENLLRWEVSFIVMCVISLLQLWLPTAPEHDERETALAAANSM